MSLQNISYQCHGRLPSNCSETDKSFRFSTQLVILSTSRPMESSWVFASMKILLLDKGKMGSIDSIAPHSFAQAEYGFTDTSSAQHNISCTKVQHSVAGSSGGNHLLLADRIYATQARCQQIIELRCVMNRQTSLR